jgi:hypothetical protein
MLPEQLQHIKDHLDDLKAKRQKMTRNQLNLSRELDFLDTNDLVQLGLEEYLHEEIKLESFAVALAVCPSCGRKY